LNDPKHHDPLKVIRKVLPFTTIALVVAAIYVGWMFFSRWQDNRELERKRAEAAAENAREVVSTLGGDDLKILSLTLDRGLIRRGEKLQLCYGVLNAKKVTIEPPPREETWPSTNRCVEVAPTRDTTYKLTAEDAAGHKQSASVQVKAR
jgi:hypothetical protein